MLSEGGWKLYTLRDFLFNVLTNSVATNTVHNLEAFAKSYAKITFRIFTLSYRVSNLDIFVPEASSGKTSNLPTLVVYSKLLLFISHKAYIKNVSD